MAVRLPLPVVQGGRAQSFRTTWSRVLATQRLPSDQPERRHHFRGKQVAADGRRKVTLSNKQAQAVDHA